MSVFDLFNFNFLATHAIFVGLFIVLAMSLSLINGCAGMFSLGHQGFWAVGAYAAGATALELAGTVPGGVAFAASVVAGIVAAAIAGVVVGVPCLRLRGDYLAIVTLGFSEIVRVLLNNFESLGGSRGLRLPALVLAKTPETATAHVVFYLVLTSLAVATTAVVCHNLLRSGHGRAVFAIRDDETAAELLGVPVARYRVTIFVLGAGFAGLAGAIYANFFGVLSPKDFGIMTGVFLLLIVVLGGRGSLSGAVAATFVLYGSQQLLKLRLLGIPAAIAERFWGDSAGAADIEQFAADRWQLIFAALLIAVVVAFPEGLRSRKGAK